MINQICVQARKEWCEFKRDRLSMALAFLLPLFSLVLFGYGIRMQSNAIPLYVQDNDHTYLSREYIARLYATNILVPIKDDGTKLTNVAEAQARREAAGQGRSDLAGQAGQDAAGKSGQDFGLQAAQDVIDKGLAKVSVVIPHGFTAKIFKEETSPLQVFVDGTDIANAQIVSNTIRAVNLYFIEQLVQSRVPNINLEMVTPQVRVWFNPGLAEPLFIVPGAFGVILWMYPALLAAVAASREKEQDTIIRVYASKVSPTAFLLGKALIYFVVGMALAVMIIVAGAALFQFAPVGDPTPLILATPLYVLSSVVFGLMLGTFANSQTTAVQATSSAGFFPCLLLSGFVYPIYNIPFPLSLCATFVPAQYFIELTRDTFVRGAGWSAVWPVPLILVAFIFGFSLFSWLGLHRMQLKV